MKSEKLNFYDLFYIFIIGCFFGWIVEGLWTLLKKGLIVNHSALVIGPFNIVYGIGGVILTLMLYKIKDQNPFKIFVTSFITGSILEYIMSFMMEYLLGFVAWDYSSKFMNVHGRICLVYSIFWGVLGILWIKAIYPSIMELLSKTDKNIGTKLIKPIIIFLFFDALLTFKAVERGKEYEQSIPPSNKVEIVIDKYFGVNYLNNMYNYRLNK